MATLNTGDKLPGTTTSAGTGVAWTITGVGEGYRSSSGVGAEFTGTNFSFSVPTGATILGIVLKITKADTYASTTSTDNTVRLKKAGTAVGDNKASATVWPTPYPGSEFTYGGATDLWGTTWTPSDINNSGFGAFLKDNKPDNAGDHYIVSFKITVYYSQPDNGNILWF